MGSGGQVLLTDPHWRAFINFAVDRGAYQVAREPRL
jgi:hypothetical protein